MKAEEIEKEFTEGAELTAMFWNTRVAFAIGGKTIKESQFDKTLKKFKDNYIFAPTFKSITKHIYTYKPNLD